MAKPDLDPVQLKAKGGALDHSVVLPFKRVQHSLSLSGQ